MVALLRLRRISSLLGRVFAWFSLVFLFPLAFALAHGTALLPFLIPLLLSVVLGLGLTWVSTDEDLEIEDGFLLVVLCWVGVSLLGAIPFLISGIGSLAHPVNALFESVSGFTATGSTVMLEISLEKYPHALMFWRQFTQWLGGMGILVLAVAILPRLGAGGAQFLDAEVPGPRMERLTPHIAETARRLWLLYLGLSVLLFGLFVAIHYGGLAPNMDPFQAISHVFTTMPTGGFSPQARSIEAFSPAVQWLIIPFMFVGAMNFTLLWRAMFVTPSSLVQDTEFKSYLGLFAGLGLLVSAMLWLEGRFATVEESLREGFFQLTTFLTTTGYASTDFSLWSGETLAVLIGLMLVSGCSGSTSGGLKILRWVVGWKVIAREVFQMIHPSAVRPLRMSGRVLKNRVVQGATVLLVTYLSIALGSTVLVAMDAYRMGLNLEVIEAFTAVAATLGNIGPGVGVVGPMENFEFFPVPTKLLMYGLMIAGRLEVMTFIVLLAPSYWRD